MSQTRFGSVVTRMTLASLLLVPASGQAQSAHEWTPPRTPDGQPDIQGVWANCDLSVTASANGTETRGAGGKATP
jgi:hypothetical protein